MKFPGDAGRFFRRFLERLLGRHVEGQAVPPRIREESELQLIRSRAWTPKEWAAFAADLAEASYRDGYRRGFERGAEEVQGIPSRRPGIVGDEERRNWSIWSGHPSTVEMMLRRGDPGDPIAGVDSEDAKDLIERLRRHPGTYGVR